MTKQKFSEEDILFVSEALQWIFDNNYFNFNGKTFHQILGIVMGTSWAPNFANLIMAFMEQKIIQTQTMNLQGYY